MQVSVECTHKTLRLFKIQLDVRTIMVLLIIWFIWGILSFLKIL